MKSVHFSVMLKAKSTRSKSPSQAPLESEFCTDYPLENVQNFRKEGFVRIYSDAFIFPMLVHIQMRLIHSICFSVQGFLLMVTMPLSSTNSEGGVNMTNIFLPVILLMVGMLGKVKQFMQKVHSSFLLRSLDSRKTNFCFQSS